MAQIRKKNLKNGSSYEVRIHRAGYGQRSKSFRTLAEAKAWANATESKINKGDLDRGDYKKIPLKIVFEDYIEDYFDPKTRKKANIREVQRLTHLSGPFGEISVGALDHVNIERFLIGMMDKKIEDQDNFSGKRHPLYQGHVKRKYSGSTIRKYYYQLKKTLEWHAKQNNYPLDPYLFKDQPVPGSWEGVRSRRLEEYEECLLYMSALAGYEKQDESVHIIAFALETGMRVQEILKAKWKDYSEEKRTLNIPAENVKTKVFRQIPLSSIAIKILKAQDELTKTERIFNAWKDSDNLSKHFRRICHRAQIQDLKFHDLRHECISRFFEDGKLSDMEIMKISGHTEYSTIARYANLRPSDMVIKML